MSSDYDRFLTDGPQNVLDDTDKGMDGTVKHFTKIGNERLCDRITDRYGNATLLTYNQASIGGVTKGLLSTVTDPSGRTLTFHWQDLNAADPTRPAYRIVRADGPQYSVAYSYNADFNLSATTLDAGDGSHLNRTTTYGYTSVTGDSGTETGLLASISDPLGHSVSYGYSLKDTDGHPMNMGNVWVQTVTEPGGLDANNQARSQVWTIGGGQFTPDRMYTKCWNNNPDYSKWINFSIRTDASLRTAMLFTDADHGFIKVWISEYFYDSSNNMTQRASGQEGSVVGHSDLYNFGPHGNQLTHSLYGLPGVETTTYYNAGQYFQKQTVTNMLGHTTTIGVGSSADPNPGSRGSMLWVQDAGYGDPASPSFNRQFNCLYNAFGQKTSETSLSGVVTQYSYGDQWGNLTQVVQDPHVSSGDGHLARTTSMVYDVAGHVLSSVDPMNHSTVFAYNVLGQPHSASMPATPSTPAETLAYGYDGGGRTFTVADNRGTTTIAYENGSDRVHSVTDPVTGTIAYTYGLSGERTSMTLPGGNAWTYAFTWQDPQNGYSRGCFAKDDPDSITLGLTSITDDQGRRADYYADKMGALLWAKTNQVFTTQNPPSLVSYCETDYTYDRTATNQSHGWLKTIANTFHSLNVNNQWQSRLLTQNDYTQDTIGQRLTNTISSLDVNGNSVSRTEQYGYDALNRLKTVDYGDGQTQAYAFDAMGNRLQKQDSAAGTENYSYNSANMLLTRGANNYTNDADGNTLTGGGRTNTWDSQNRLVRCVNGANTSSFIYGSDGIRRQSTVNGTTTDFVLDASMFVQERNHATGVNTATYFVGARGPEYRRDETTGQVRWYIYDGLGSVLGEVDPSGNITSSRKYDVYGLIRGGNNPSGTSSHKYVGALGHPSEDNTGLIYMRARYYDPVIGRFASQDPARHGSNWFAYCHGNPTNYYDSNGKDETIVSVEVGMSMSELFAGFAEMLGAIIAEGAMPFIVEGQILAGRAAYVVYGLMGELGIAGGTADFDMWAIKTMGGAGGQFIKAWVTVNAEQEMWYLLGEEGEIFVTHATPYVSGLQGY